MRIEIEPNRENPEPFQSYYQTHGKKVSPESERYEECLFGYSQMLHTDLCTFTLVFSHGNKSCAGQGAPFLG